MHFCLVVLLLGKTKRHFTSTVLYQLFKTSSNSFTQRLFYRDWSLLNKVLLVFVLFYCTSFTLASHLFGTLTSWLGCFSMLEILRRRWRYRFFPLRTFNFRPQMAPPAFFQQYSSSMQASSSSIPTPNIRPTSSVSSSSSSSSSSFVTRYTQYFKKFTIFCLLFYVPNIQLLATPLV